jgi:hypothetical protein
MRTSAIDRQKINKVKIKETFGFLIALLALVVIPGVILGLILKIQ